MFTRIKNNGSNWIYVGPITVIGTTTPIGILLVRKCSITQDVEFLEKKHNCLSEMSLEEYETFFKALYLNEPTSPPPPRKRNPIQEIIIK